MFKPISFCMYFSNSHPQRHGTFCPTSILAKSRAQSRVLTQLEHILTRITGKTRTVLEHDAHTTRPRPNKHIKLLKIRNLEIITAWHATIKHTHDRLRGRVACHITPHYSTKAASLPFFSLQEGALQPLLSVLALGCWVTVQHPAVPRMGSAVS